MHELNCSQNQQFLNDYEKFGFLEELLKAYDILHWASFPRASLGPAGVILRVSTHWKRTITPNNTVELFLFHVLLHYNNHFIAANSCASIWTQLQIQRGKFTGKCFVIWFNTSTINVLVSWCNIFSYCQHNSRSIAQFVHCLNQALWKVIQPTSEFQNSKNNLNTPVNALITPLKRFLKESIARVIGAYRQLDKFYIWAYDKRKLVNNSTQTCYFIYQGADKPKHTADLTTKVVE